MSTPTFQSTTSPTTPAKTPATNAETTSQQEVSVVAIEHNYGTDVTAHATPDLARQHVHAYVAMWWTEETGEPLPSLLTEEDVAHYFENVKGESVTVETVVVRTTATTGAVD